MCSSAEPTATAPESSSLIDELIGITATGGLSERLRILQRVTDLFVAGSRRYSGDQIALFDEILQELTADIELKARARLAQRLAGVDRAPPNIIRRLAFDDAIAVAGPVLVHSRQLNDADLVENATSKSQDHLFAIAQRLKLSERVTDVLVERGNRRVVRKLAGNKGARFSPAGYSRITDRARRDARLALTLGQRSDIPRQCFLRLLENASASVRARLEAIAPHAADAIRDTIGDVASAMQNETRRASRHYAAAARDANRRFRTTRVTEANVHAPAQAQEFEKTVVALAKLGRFPVDLVERALLDEGQDMVLILAKAANCSWTTAKELLQMYAARRCMTPDETSLAFERYRKLSHDTARKVVKFHELRMARRSRAPAFRIRPAQDRSAAARARSAGADRVVLATASGAAG
ncbi:MAG: DUF2336 domain-containing protein [Pseudorhodoplanes sp.]|nr:DUF2336 domain-containing protein [Pseudorhodoplanes sp.]